MVNFVLAVALEWLSAPKKLPRIILTLAHSWLGTISPSWLADVSVMPLLSAGTWHPADTGAVVFWKLVSE